MKQISRNNKVCTAVGTSDNLIDQEIQTEISETDDSWTQNTESAKTRSSIISSDVLNFSLVPEDCIKSASKIAEILLTEIDQEKIDSKLNLPQNSIKNVFHDVSDISTDWERIAISTSDKVFIYHLSNLLTPMFEISIQPRVSLLSNSKLIIGTGYGSLGLFSFSSASVTYTFGGKYFISIFFLLLRNPRKIRKIFDTF